jgi:hypothetical protein
MKLERIDDYQHPGYPTLKSHQGRANTVVKTAMGGLALAALAGCCQSGIDDNPPVIMGEMPAVVQPPTPDKLPGEPRAPQKQDVIPDKDPPEMMGIMIAPRPPAEEDK